MKIQRIDHVGITVNDLAAAKEFFLDLGLELQAEFSMEGAWLDKIVGLKGVKTENVMLQTPDHRMSLEISKYHAPAADKGLVLPQANTFGIRHIAFVVEDLEAIVAKLRSKGMETFSDIQNYENIWKLLYVRGPEGIILELTEPIKPGEQD
jgi:catechol 2,3-dioxygenase-like lactoylglutathione lyase family enzyme